MYMASRGRLAAIMFLADAPVVLQPHAAAHPKVMYRSFATREEAEACLGPPLASRRILCRSCQAQ